MPMTSLKAFILFIFTGAAFGDNTYRITDESVFSSFIRDVNSGTNYLSTTVYLDTDLSLSSYSSLSPIGINYTYQFRGVFDGQGHVISDFSISSSSLQHVGLFGYSVGTTIKNVVLDSSCSLSSSYNSDFAYVGGIIGKCESRRGNCSIENCVNMGNVTFSGEITNNLYAGGIVGNLFNSSSSYNCVVKNCANYGSVVYSGGISGYISFIGGIVGESWSRNSSYNYNYIQNCLNYGTIDYSGTTSNSVRIGGIVGHSYYTYIENCVSTGKVSSRETSTSETSYIGSVVGRVNNNTYINYCYFTNDVGLDSLYDSDSPYSPSSTTGKSTSYTTINSTLINNLNSQATNNCWNKWLLNSNNASVSFKVNNNKCLSFSSQIILLPDLSSGSLMFSGWYTDNLFNSTFSSSSVSSDTMFYGGWLISVTLNANGGGGNVPTSKNVVYNNTYGYLPTPSKTGYIFAGWYTKTSEGIHVINSTIVTTPYDHTLYAQWIEVVETNQVEILFKKKDLSEMEIKEIIEKYTDANFTIIKFEDEESGEIRVIVKFVDVEDAKNFVENINVPSNSATDNFKFIGFFVDKKNSFSFSLCPLLLSFCFLLYY